ncbi:MAG TPA: hypothetical protein VEK56_02600 [Vicinamibacterales bacterium]|nr:hypothetical protein [Vicinamibacterales bacterium]
MRHWWSVVILVAAILFLGSLGARAQDGLELKGSLNANDTERDEGYFALAQDTVLVVRPGTAVHRWLKAHAGQTVRLIVEPDTKP